uniref:Uncharacterized protein n=1 Tax=Arundo donax TaxID=35708 RepID=A0A0A9AXE0_ARUDO
MLHIQFGSPAFGNLWPNSPVWQLLMLILRMAIIGELSDQKVQCLTSKKEALCMSSRRLRSSE